MYNEIKGDLFKANTCLAHCVSRDFSMSAGIALKFSKLFGGKEELKKQDVDIGGVAFLYSNNRYIYYLVTKEHYWEKPTYENIRKSIKYLFFLCVVHNITSLSIPKLGCGLDKLEWNNVKQIIFEEWPQIMNFTLNVYSL